MAAKNETAGQVKITLVRSTIGRPGDQERAVRSLGLRKVNQTVVRIDDSSTRGAINKIAHLVEVETVSGE